MFRRATAAAAGEPTAASTTKYNGHSIIPTTTDATTNHRYRPNATQNNAEVRKKLKQRKNVFYMLFVLLTTLLLGPLYYGMVIFDENKSNSKATFVKNNNHDIRIFQKQQVQNNYLEPTNFTMFNGSYVYKDTPLCHQQFLQFSQQQTTTTTTKSHSVCGIHFPIPATSATTNKNHPWSNTNHFALVTQAGTPKPEMLTPLQLQRQMLLRLQNKQPQRPFRINQDRALLISPLLLSKDNNKDWFLGLFDGHGDYGHHISQYLLEELPLYLFSNLLEGPTTTTTNINTTREERTTNRSILSPTLSTNTRNEIERIQQAIHDAYLQVDQEILKSTTSVPQKYPKSGSTAIAILKLNQYLYISNVGDSSSFLIGIPKKKKRKDTTTTNNNNINITTNNNNIDMNNNFNSRPVKILYTNEHHKPDKPMERKRILENGGQVYDKPLGTAGTSRVIIPLENGIEILGLAMSRSMGDPEGKRQRLLTAIPTIDVLDMVELKQQKQNRAEDYQYFAVLVSDGLLEKVPSPVEIGNYLYEQLYGSDENTNNSNTTKSSLEEICKNLVNKAVLGWTNTNMIVNNNPFAFQPYRDDITIAITELLL